MAEPDEPETFESLRPLLFSIAYRMLSSVSDAEDIVQEAFLRYQRARTDGTVIDSLRAYLSAAVTRLAIDQLRSARTRRESYVGEWLPEPLLTDRLDHDDPATHAEQADSLSMAFLLLLDRLTPVERAVFLLHDVFGYDYDEIASIVGKSEANCRQQASRARRHLHDDKPRFDIPPRADELADRFFSAMGGGDMDELVELLAADAVVYGDGGGKAPQWMRPVLGVDRVAPLLTSVGRDIETLSLTVERRQVNGQPGGLMRDADGRLINVFVLDIVEGAVRTVRSVINPDKLGHLGPLADIPSLRRRRPG